MLTLNVNAKFPASITSALKKIREMIMAGSVKKDTPVHIILEAGVYRESVRYNLSNPLVIESAPGTKARDCIIKAENCEAFHKGRDNRSIFAIGPNATNVTLKNFSIVNTHTKLSATVAPSPDMPDASEALSFLSEAGTLFAEGVRLESRQNTLFVQGFSWFKGCYIAGSVDFIYGEPNTAFFEECEVCTVIPKEREAPCFAIKSGSIAHKTGFVFSSCRFTAEGAREVPLFACRTEGIGTSTSSKGWDNVAFVNCLMSDAYSEELAWDDDMTLNIFPRGNSSSGIREYNTRIVAKNGKVAESDTTLRNRKTYLLTEDDYLKEYASRYLILRSTPFNKAE